MRWYEINPTNGTLFQTGIAQSPTLYVFTGAIAPDRQGATSTAGAFGGNMALGVNTSSSTTYPALQMVTKKSGVTQSALISVQSKKADTDFTCGAKTPCRWGDYAGASPDPAPSSTSGGTVWLSGMLGNGGSRFTAGWTTWNWQVTP